MSQAGQQERPTFRERLRRGLLLFAGVYILICAGCATLQRRLIYYPSVFPGDQVDRMAEEAGLERWTSSTGQLIGMKRPSPRQPAAGTVLLLYGNGSTAVGCHRYAD